MSATETLRPPTSVAALDATLERLAAGKAEWARVGIEERVRLLDRCLAAIPEIAERWVEEACRHKGEASDGPVAGEEWLSGPATTARGLRLLRDALKAGGAPRPARRFRRPDGSWAADVFPLNALERTLYFGVEAELRIVPGEEPTQGRVYREPPGPGGVAAVLGAGNIASIAPLDVFHKLIVDNEVVALKMNPVNDYLGPFFEHAFAPLIAAGRLALVYGGVEEGDRLVTHPLIDSIHLTGSEATHDAIVWGADPEERARRKAEGRPRVDKRVTSELGCVTPILVCPGDWTGEELDHQARQVASTVTHNASFNCNAGKVLVLAEGWPQRDDFLARVRIALELTPQRRAYYPGAERRYEEFLARYPQAEPLTDGGPGVVPWTLIPDVPPRAGEHALTAEAFCGVLAQVDLPASGAAEFLARATEFANESVRGTLSCALLVDERTARDRAAELEAALDGLRYGGVAVNAWPGINFYLGQPSWGAYPGHTLAAVGSGIGHVHNTLLFDHPQKTIVRAPFRMWPKPVWFSDHRTLLPMARSLARFEATGSPIELLRLAPRALMG